MSDQDVNDEVESGDDEGGAPKKRFSGRTLILFVILPLILLLAGGGAAAFFLLSGDEAPVEEQAENGTEPVVDEKGQPAVVFYDLPEMLVNMNTTDKRKHFLKIKVSLELESAESIPELEAVMPRIIDGFQVYLRELRLDDLKGSAGLLRLKEELLIRVNATARPIKVNDVLFKEMLVQ